MSMSSCASGSGVNSVNDSDDDILDDVIDNVVDNLNDVDNSDNIINDDGDTINNIHNDNKQYILEKLIIDRKTGEQCIGTTAESTSWRTHRITMVQKKSFKKTRAEKISVGIACCRTIKDTSANNIIQLLCVQKRYTYAYCDFIKSIYKKSDLKRLLNNMTIEEKIDICSLNFDKIWYRIWLDSPKIPQYFQAKATFESTYLADSGVKLLKLIEKSTSVKLIWEIPKGRKKRGETDINGAVREFEEETGVGKSAYKIYPYARYKYQFTSDETIYRIQYYIAQAIKTITPTISFSHKEQIKEISDIKWMDIREIRYIDDENHRLTTAAEAIFKYIKTRM